MKHSISFIQIAIFFVVLLLSGGSCLGLCDQPSHSREVLSKQGFTEIQTTGHAFFACGKDDSSSVGFEATNATGQRVTGVVCCGLIAKNCTVRW